MIYFIGFIAVILGVALDQYTKYLAVNHLQNNPISIIEGVFELRYLENRGAAFGMLQNKQTFFLIITIITLSLIGYLYYRLPKTKHFLWLRICLLSITAGAIGNMIDRTIKGFVVDFFDFTLIDFAVFNVADTFICIGVGLIFLDVLLGKSDYSFLDGEKQILDSEKDKKDETYTD